MMRALSISLGLVCGCAGPAPLRFAHVRSGEQFSQAVRVDVAGGALLFVSGQVAIDAEGQLVGRGDMTRQTEQVFDNLSAVLAAEGATLSDIAKLTIFVTDMSQRPAVSAVRARYLPGPKPASTFVEVSKLAGDELLVEIEAIAVKPAR